MQNRMEKKKTKDLPTLVHLSLHSFVFVCLVFGEFSVEFSRLYLYDWLIAWISLDFDFITVAMISKMLSLSFLPILSSILTVCLSCRLIVPSELLNGCIFDPMIVSVSHAGFSVNRDNCNSVVAKHVFHEQPLVYYGRARSVGRTQRANHTIGWSDFELGRGKIIENRWNFEICWIFPIISNTFGYRNHYVHLQIKPGHAVTSDLDK